jgi:asparagine synthase (glutamine-hydrolysing)
MCGIAGFTHRKGRPDDAIISRAIESIRHRGPDQHGVHRGLAASLGAVRLKILDLTGGDQPIVSDDGGTVICFNGEIYNFRELRSELEALGHTFHSRCDTEVVLHAFLEWDTECFARLRGMFAVALWQEERKRLVLARDRMGIKPLYYRIVRKDVHFGSEVKAVLAHWKVERRIDLRALDLFLAYNYGPSDRSLIDGVHKLRPGWWLEWRNGSTKMGPYWTLRFAPDNALGFDDAKAQLDSLLAASVKEHLASDVPLGVWLSGGLDSSTIVHYAAESFPGRLKTFSVSFAGRSFDESPYFRQVAERYGTDHHEFDLNPQRDLADVIERMVWHSDEPTADAGALPVWYLSQMSRQQVTVALSGEGADELFGGYITYLADRYSAWARLMPRPLLGALRSAANLLPVSDEKVSAEYKVKRFLDGALLNPVDAHLFWNGSFSPAQRAAVKKHNVDGQVTPWRLPPGDSVNRFLYLDQLAYLPDDILNKCDRMSMAHSLEIRPPFLDHRIIEFAARLPIGHKIRGRSLKHILRSLMAPRLPADVARRSKQGFDIPTHHWFRTVLRPLLLDTVNERTVARTGLFHWAAIHRMMQEHFDRRANHGYQLWGLLTLFIWLRQWKIDTGIPSSSS